MKRNVEFFVNFLRLILRRHYTETVGAVAKCRLFLFCSLSPIRDGKVEDAELHDI